MTCAPALLVIAESARALAVSARRAGFAPISIDAFADEDTRAMSQEAIRVGNAMGGFAGIDLEPLVARLCASYRPIGLIYGSGFDDCPETLAPLARHVQILGAPNGLTNAKDPLLFSELCATAGIAHPRISFARARARPNWLVKKRGGAGGLHVEPNNPGRTLRAGEYWQERVVGRSVSLLFVRDEITLTPIGWSEQWTSPSPTAPFRYGGAAGPIDFEPPEGLLEGLGDLTLWLGARGLASADFIVDGETFWLLEINPRPGATLDLFDDEDDPLLARHIAWLTDEPVPPVKPRTPGAAEIVYAEEDAIIPLGEWPEGAADRSAAGTRIPSGYPVCTVAARGETVAEAKVRVKAYAGRVRSWLQEGSR